MLKQLDCVAHCESDYVCYSVTYLVFIVKCVCQNTGYLCGLKANYMSVDFLTIDSETSLLFIQNYI